MAKTLKNCKFCCDLVSFRSSGQGGHPPKTTQSMPCGSCGAPSQNSMTDMRNPNRKIKIRQSVVVFANVCDLQCTIKWSLRSFLWHFMRSVCVSEFANTSMLAHRFYNHKLQKKKNNYEQSTTSYSIKNYITRYKI